VKLLRFLSRASGCVGGGVGKMSKKLQEEKRLKRLRDLMSLPDNKRCMDCLEKVRAAV
jgi:hypothetical protein